MLSGTNPENVPTSFPDTIYWQLYQYVTYNKILPVQGVDYKLGYLWAPPASSCIVDFLSDKTLGSTPILLT